jgi:hypothetical protein
MDTPGSTGSHDITTIEANPTQSSSDGRGAHRHSGVVVWHFVQTRLFRDFIFSHVGELPNPTGCGLTAPVVSTRLL